MSRYNETTKKDALRLYMDHVPMSEIAKRDAMPARATLYRWRDDGACTGGVPWNEYRSQKEAEAIKEGATENEVEWRGIVDDVNEVLDVTLQRMKAGKMSVKASDLKHLLSVKADVEKAQREHEKGSWRRKVANRVIKEFLRAVHAETAGRTFDAIVENLKDASPVEVKP